MLLESHVVNYAQNLQEMRLQVQVRDYRQFERRVIVRSNENEDLRPFFVETIILSILLVQNNMQI